MQIEQTPEIRSENELSKLVGDVSPFLQERLPPTASGLWDVRRDARGRSLAVLVLRDPWGSAVAEFAPEELANPSAARSRIHHLVGELVYSARRERIEIRDAFASAQQIADLQHRINSIPNIVSKKPKLYNRIQLSPEQADRFLITDFAIEVDGDVADLVKAAVRESGFNLHGSPLLQRHGIRDRVAALVAQHCREPYQPPRYAVCFRLQDPVDLHLLEIADDAVSPEDGSLEGVGCVPGDALPGARSIVFYLATPQELRLALRRNPMHPAVRGLQSDDRWFVHPSDNGEAFYREFPEFREISSELAKS